MWPNDYVYPSITWVSSVFFLFAVVIVSLLTGICKKCRLSVEFVSSLALILMEYLAVEIKTFIFSRNANKSVLCAHLNTQYILCFEFCNANQYTITWYYAYKSNNKHSSIFFARSLNVLNIFVNRHFCRSTLNRPIKLTKVKENNYFWPPKNDEKWCRWANMIWYERAKKAKRHLKPC